MKNMQDNNQNISSIRELSYNETECQQVVNKYNSQNFAHNNYLALTVKGQFDIEKLQLAINQMIEQNDILRTSYKFINNKATALVYKTVSAPIDFIDLSGISYFKKRYKLISELKLPKNFDITTPPLLYTKICKLSKNHHAVFFGISHIIADGWSCAIMLHHLLINSQQGKDFCQESMDYISYIKEQQNIIQSAQYEKEITFWHQQLKGIKKLNLPIKGHYDMIDPSRGNMAFTRATSAVKKAIDHLAKQKKTCSYVISLTIFCVVLYAWTRQNKLLFKGINANRKTNKKYTLGYITNHYCIVSDINPDHKFSELLTKMHQFMVQAKKHFKIPFRKILQQCIDSGDKNMINVFFNVHSYPIIPKQNNHKYKLIPRFFYSDFFWGDETELVFDLIFDQKQNMFLVIRYIDQLFTQQQIKMFLRHYKKILKTVTKKPETKIADLGNVKK